MFRSSFQGGPCVEIFNPVNKELYTNWSLSKHVTKEYDKTSKTVTCFLQGESTTQQMFTPKDKKKSLGLIQHYLVVQIYSYENQRFSMDVRVSCKSGSHRRVTFFSHKRSLQLTPLFADVPLDLPSQSMWSHLVINFLDVVSELWHEEFKSIDSLSLCGRCNVRQIYTVHENLIEQPNCKSWESRYMECLPKKCKFPVKVPQAFHLIGKTFISLKCANKKSSSACSKTFSDGESVADAARSSTSQQSSVQSSVMKFRSPGIVRRDLNINGGKIVPSSSSSAQPPTRIRVTSLPLQSIARTDPSHESSSEESSQSKISIPGPEAVLRVQNLHNESSESSASAKPLPSYFANQIDISSILPRYTHRDVWIPQVPSSSDTLPKQISMDENEEDDVKDSRGAKSVHDLFKQYVEQETSVRDFFSPPSSSSQNEKVDFQRASISTIPPRFNGSQHKIQSSHSDDEVELIQLGLKSKLSLNASSSSNEIDFFSEAAHSDD